MDPGVKVTLSKHQPPPHRPLRRPGRGQNDTALLSEPPGKARSELCVLLQEQGLGKGSLDGGNS